MPTSGSGSATGPATPISGYASLADLKAAMASTGTFDPLDTSDDALLQDCLDAAKVWIDHRTGRLFGVGVQGVRYFYSTETAYLAVDDAATVTEVAIDANLDGSFTQIVPAAQWEFLPLNLGTPGVLGQASAIHLFPTSSYAFTPGWRVRVTGTWGYGSVPTGVKLACVRLAQRAFKLLREAPFGVIQSPELGTFARIAREDGQVEAWLAPYLQAAARWAIA